MKHSPFNNPEDEELFNEFCILNGIKMVAAKSLDDLPSDKNILILHTNDKMLFRRLRSWAYRSNSVIYYNPQCNDYGGLQKILAIVIDRPLMSTTLIPDSVSDRVLWADLDYDLIENILDSIAYNSLHKQNKVSNYERIHKAGNDK